MKKRFFIIFILIICLFSTLAADYKQQKKLIKNNAFLKGISSLKQFGERVNLPNPFDFSQKERKPATVKILNPSRSRDEIEIFINGEETTSVTQGDDFVLTIYFSTDSNTANLIAWVDLNNNGTLEEDEDFMVDEPEELIDNDINDENPANGVYQKTYYAADDGPNNVGNLGLLFSATDSGGSDVAYLFIEAITGDYSVSGDVTPAMSNLIVGAISMETDATWMVMTDDDGHYQDFVDSPGLYMIITFDPLGLTGGMTPDTTYINVQIDGHLTGYDFHYLEPTSAIEGTVLDNFGNPVSGITVGASHEGMSDFTDITDENGNYHIGVSAGFWQVGLNGDDLIPDYLVPDQEFVNVADEETATQNFVVYVANATIEGTVYLDENPIAGINVYGNNPLGSTESTSQIDGSYTLSVSSMGDSEGGYSVNIWDIPPDTYVEEQYNGVASGSDGIDFYLHTANGGLDGYVFDNETEEPLDSGWISATQDYQQWFHCDVENDGHYHLALPNGIFDVFAHNDDYYQDELLQIEIQDDFINHDFYLEPVNYDGALWGYIYEQGSGNPIEGANIWVSNEDYWNGTTSDENGYYYIPLPNGTYGVDVSNTGYSMVHMNGIEIMNLEVQQNFYLEPISFDGSISGYVFEDSTETPLEDVAIWVSSTDYWMGTNTDENGYYYLDLPNGTYSLNASKEGYDDVHFDNIEINNDDITQDIYLVPNVNADENEIASILLLQNFPNPFRTSTTISYEFSTEQNEQRTISIYNIKGQKIKQLRIKNYELGINKISWDGKDENGKQVQSGIYFFKLRDKNGKFTDTKKMILMK